MTRKFAPGRLLRAVLFSSIFAVVVGTCFGDKSKTPDTSNKSFAFRRAPASVYKLQNPAEGQPKRAAAGRKLFVRHCAQCHGEHAEGGRNAPPLRSDRVQEAPDGVLFWFLKEGNPRAGMPSWSGLPPAQRWQIVSFLKSLQ